MNKKEINIRNAAIIILLLLQIVSLIFMIKMKMDNNTDSNIIKNKDALNLYDFSINTNYYVNTDKVNYLYNRFIIDDGNLYAIVNKDSSYYSKSIKSEYGNIYLVSENVKSVISQNLPYPNDVISLLIIIYKDGSTAYIKPYKDLEIVKIESNIKATRIVNVVIDNDSKIALEDENNNIFILNDILKKENDAYSK